MNPTQYGKVLISRSFDTRPEAEDFAKDMKAQYKEADLSLRYDVARNEGGGWKTTVYAKL